MFLCLATALIGVFRLVGAAPVITETNITVDLGYTVQEGRLEVSLA